MRPITAAAAARTSSIFLPGCSQFVVEYAGDFLTQDSISGNVTAVAADGVTDWVYDSRGSWVAGTAYVPGDVVYWNNIFHRCIAPHTATLVREPPAPGFWATYQPARKTRWYGFPRDVHGDGFIFGWSSGRVNSSMPDVVPLRDVIRTAPGMAASDGAPFERDMAAKLPPKATYSSTTAGIAYDAEYTCAWGPTPDASAASPRPKMLRITLMLEDAAGRLNDAQAYEYVLNLPSQ